ncbi:hypothetical protein [uncultured Tenacibaculum sp.]|uniref:hypothetical protein n=1 Tax=uncultured Tenacibaculum sp. TaxID=174713 RepID=UPI00260743CF|nr:hypothetical protein [uncultured Tenacibaculum sp.]
MGYAKDQVNLQARRQFILEKVDELLKNPNNSIYTFTDAYHYIADEYLFCSVSTIYRAISLKEQKKSLNTPSRSTNVLTLKFD